MTESQKENVVRSLEDNNFIEIKRDGTTTEWTVSGKPIQISHVRLRDSDSGDSLSPTPSLSNTSPENVVASQVSCIMDLLLILITYEN